jgi:hypothetical protein
VIRRRCWQTKQNNGNAPDVGKLCTQCPLMNARSIRFAHVVAGMHC